MFHVRRGLVVKNKALHHHQSFASISSWLGSGRVGFIGCVSSTLSSPDPDIRLSGVYAFVKPRAFGHREAALTSLLSACTSFRARHSSILSHKCALRTRFSEAQEQEPEVAAASSASAQAPRAPTGSRGCVHDARGECPRSARQGEGRLPVCGSVL